MEPDEETSWEKHDRNRDEEKEKQEEFGYIKWDM